MKPWIAAAFAMLLVPATAQTAGEWLTFGFEPSRSGWNPDETALTPKTVGKLKLLWSTQLSTPLSDVALSTLTAPLVAAGIDTAQGKKNLAFTVGADDTLFALDADSGKVVWQKNFANAAKPQRPANTNCSNTEQATPVIDKARGLIFATMGDGKLRALALGSGEERMTATPMVAPFSRNWSLNLIDNVVYTAAGRGCGGDAAQKIEPGAVSAMDVSDLAHPQLSRFQTGQGRPAGPWGRGGPVKGPKGVYVQTADGARDPATGIHGNAVLAVAPKAYGLLDSFTPASWQLLNEKDLDLGSGSPTIFSFHGRTLLATSSKEGVIYILNAERLGGPDHSQPLLQSPRIGNDAQEYYGQGVWGQISTMPTADGDRILFVPMWGPPGKAAQFPVSRGAAPHGSIMAFRLSEKDKALSLTPLWMSRDLALPDNVAVAGGVVYAVQTGEQPAQHYINPEGHGSAKAGEARETPEALAKFRSTPLAPMILFALDAETGKELYSSGKLLGNWVHFSQPAVAQGKVFVVSHDAHVYAFGLK
jgi:outer membrane protein assembly factor BamB